jgi:hypothetical protein
LVGIVGASAIGSGCTAKKPTELVPGVFAQVEVPRDLAQIRVDVMSNGGRVFCRSYDVTNGMVLLPATLGVVSQTSPATTVTVEIRGYDPSGSGGNDVLSCGTAAVNSPDGPRVLRRSIQTFVDEHTLFLPMPLSYSCFDADCSQTGASATCKGAQCVSAATVASSLVDFNPSLIDGSQGCFPPNECFAAQAPAVLVDTTSCTYRLPQGQPPGAGINVRIFYQDFAWVLNPVTKLYEPQVKGTSEQEILSNDAAEGFLPVARDQFQLAPGLCNLANAASNPPAPPPSASPPPAGAGYRTIGNVLVSTSCKTKLPLLPICRSGQAGAAKLADGGTTTDVACNVALPLVPAPSAVYLVMDNSREMGGAFGTDGYATAMNLSLAAPVFKRTFVAFKFLPHLPLDCSAPTTSFSLPDLDFGLAQATQPKIAATLLQWMPPAGSQDLYLEAAMRPEGAYGPVAQFARGLGETLNVGAVMFFVNRTPTSPGGGFDGGVDPTLGVDCPPPDALTTMQTAVQAAYNGGHAAADGTPSLYTYFVVLDNPEHKPPVAFFNQVASGGGATTLDSTSMNGPQVLASFAQTMIAVGTCLYELPPGVDASASLAYGVFHTPIPQAPGCSADQQTVNGWSIDAGHIRICGQSCTDLRNAVFAASLGALQAAGPDAGTATSVPEVPVTATMQCAVAGDQ